MNEAWRHRLRIGPLALLVVAAVAVGCGGGEAGSADRVGEAASSGAQAGAAEERSEIGAGESTAPGPQSGDPKAKGGSATNGDSDRKDRDEAGRGDPEGPTERAKPETESRQTARGPGGRCPSSISRAQCKADAEQARSAEPSYPVGSPAACGKTMSRPECEAMFAAEKAAQESGGKSVSVEECMREPSPVCEDQLAAQLEAEHANSQGK
ncbi:MAG TPA: hypothetical protein VFY48_04025 [Solirubrobacterales bacterium]|nr:hypothetical protein [Solirubrobacterales bacterium]